MPHCSYSQHVTLRVSSQTGLVLDIHTHIWSEVRAELRNFEGALIFLRGGGYRGRLTCQKPMEG